MDENKKVEFGKRPSGSAYRKCKKKREEKEEELLNSIPKLTAFGFERGKMPIDPPDDRELDLNKQGQSLHDGTMGEVSPPTSHHSPVSPATLQQLTASSSLITEGERHLQEDIYLPLPRSNDVGQWGALSMEDIDFWVQKGPTDCQNHDSDFSQSCRQYKSQNRYFSKALAYRKVLSNERITREWLLYSPSAGKVFCFPCLLFAQSHKNVFGDISIGFNDWKNAELLLKYHEQSKEHRDAVLILFTRRSVAGKIDQESGKRWSEEENYWKKLLMIVVKVVKYLASRGLPFRGHNQLIGSTENGNFLGTLELIADFDPFLRSHLDQYGNKGRGRASYLSSTIYEEIIQLMANKVLMLILTELREGKYFSLCVDSTPDISHVDQLSLVVRYVHKQSHDVKERFLQFLDILSHTGDSLSNVMLTFLEKHQIKIQDARGQSYDNAKNMSGKYKGVQARIRAINPLALYVPCASHSLNLAGVCAAESCLEATRFFGIVQQLFNFFSNSTHRWFILTSHLGPQKCVLKRLSDTRWSARADAVKALCKGYAPIQAALKDIAEDGRQAAETRAEASNLLDHLDFLETKIMALLWSTIMERFNRVTQSLQSEDLDLGSAVLMLKSLQDFVELQRDTFQKLQAEAKELNPGGKYRDAEQRQVRRKRQFDEGPSQEVILTGQERFRINGFIPIIDSLSQAIKTRTEAYDSANNLFGFLNQCWKLQPKDVEEAAFKLQALYSNDLEPDFHEELNHFVMFMKHYVAEEEAKDQDFKLRIPAMYKLIFDLDMASSFPNVEITLRIYLSLMVGVAKAERTFSKLKLIKDEKRNRMGQNYLNALSILSIERCFLEQVEFDDVISSFVQAKVRKVHI